MSRAFVQLRQQEDLDWVSGHRTGHGCVWLVCVGGLAFLVRVYLRCFPALVSDCLCIPNHCVSLLFLLVTVPELPFQAYFT